MGVRQCFEVVTETEVAAAQRDLVGEIEPQIKELIERAEGGLSGLSQRERGLRAKVRIYSLLYSAESGTDEGAGGQEECTTAEEPSSESRYEGVGEEVEAPESEEGGTGEDGGEIGEGGGESLSEGVGGG